MSAELDHLHRIATYLGQQGRINDAACILQVISTTKANPAQRLIEEREGIRQRGRNGRFL